MSYKHIIFIANDFGFGPTSRAKTIASAMHRSNPELTIQLVTTKKLAQTFSAAGIKIDTLESLRDPKKLELYLSEYNPQNTIVVSTMNRFCIEPSQKLGFKVILLDGLYWFWKEDHAKEYDSANVQVRYVLPWMLKNLVQKNLAQKYLATPIEIPEATGNIPSSKQVLISLNGFFTPFYSEKHDSYILFINDIITELQTHKDVVVTGSSGVGDIFRRHKITTSYTYQSLDKHEYMQTLASVDSVLLNGGSNSFLEAFVQSKKIYFSLPSNKSQLQLILELAAFTQCSPYQLCPALSIVPQKILQDLIRLSEKDFIDAWSDILSQQMQQPDYQDKVAQIVHKIVENFDEDNYLTIIKDLPKIQELSLSSAKKTTIVIEEFLNQA